MRTKVFGLLGLLIGCSSPVEEVQPQDLRSLPISFCPKMNVSVLIDDSFSSSQQVWIYSAIAEWSVRTGNTMVLQVEVAPARNFPVRTDDGIIVLASKLSPPLLGRTTWNTGTGVVAAIITIDLSVEDERFQTVAKHEFGHAFHLQHSADPNVVMYTYAVNRDIDYNDLLAFDHIWNCSK